ncbi:MAG: InlB B-repeat-containing protein, partial [Firmicutes bacterium]|nr:InlB B-repeat-containing protein [Candidatus Caballimonas caccae]
FTALTASATEMNRFFYGEEADFTSNGYSGMYIAGYDSVVRLKYTALSTTSARPQNAIGVVYDSDDNEVDAKLTIMDGSLLRINFNSNGEFPYTLKVKAGSKFLSPLGYYRFNFTEDFFISVGKTHETANNFNKYAVNFLKDGNLISTVAVAPNETISIPDSNPSKESTISTDYTFAYWYTNDASVEYDFATPVTSSMKINAKFNESLRQYDVKFGDEAPVKYGYGSKITKPADPTKESTISTVYTFAYWYTDDETVAFDFENETVAGDITFTAKFNESARQYDVKFGDEAPVQYDYGSKVTKPANPTKESTVSTVYAFAYWYTDDETVAFDFDNETIAGDIIFTAKFNESVRKYTITFVDEDTTVLQSGEVEYGTLPVYNGEEPTKESTSEYYYLFNGWDNEIVIVSGEATYKATYSEHLIGYEYTITFNSNGGSAVNTQVVEKDNKIIKPDDPIKEFTEEIEYTFEYWYLDNENEEFDFDTLITEDLVLNAKW